MKLNDERQSLVLGVMPMIVWFISNRKQPRWMSYEELHSEYCEAICVAASKYVLEGGRNFSGYAFHAMNFRRVELYRKSKTLKRGSELKFHSIYFQSEDGFEEINELSVFQDFKIERMEEIDVLNEEISKLEPRPRSIIKHFMQGKSFKTMEKRYVCGREKLRRIFNQTTRQLRKAMLRRTG